MIMDRKLLVALSALVLLALVNGLLQAADIEMKADFAYPLNDANDPCSVLRHERTAKYFQDANWITLTDPGWFDVYYHHDPKVFLNIGGSGIDLEVACGYAGDTGFNVHGMQCVGDGLPPTGTPIEDPICNTEICTGRHRGSGRGGDDGSVYLTFRRIPRGRYELSSYHNDLFFLDPYTPEGDEPLDPRVIHSIIAAGDGVTQIQGANNVEIQAETSDDALVPAVIVFETDGSAPVAVEYVTPPVGGQHWGGMAVVNAFALRGWFAPEAFWPQPPDGADDVHAEAVLTWRPGSHAASHDVYFGTDFDDVSNATTATPGIYIDRRDANEYDPPGSLELGKTYYWRIDEVNTAHPNSPWRAEVWSFTVDEGKAHSPTPENGAVDVVLDANLYWSRGTYAAWHDIYFGTDRDAVMNATDPNTPPGRGRQDPCDYDPCDYDPNTFDPWRLASTYDPCGLEIGQTYYWRIDEGNSLYPTLKGHIWTFTALRYITVDDMQSYDYMSNYITDTWLDGVQWPDYVSGASISLGLSEAEPPDPVYDGNQSMIYSYDNTGMYMEVPYYSEIERTFDDPCDWTAFGVKALVLYFYGDPNNDANQTEQMYVGLEDTLGPDSYAEVRYGDNGEDMNDIKKPEWQHWSIDLADFTGVTLEQIKKIYIGFGDSNDPVQGGAGIVHFDAIRLYVPRCLTEFGRLEGDLNDDCVVDFKDVRIMVLVWLDIDRVEVSPPDRAGLLVEYTFDNGPNDFNDTSGNERHGTPGLGATVSDGKLVLDGSISAYVDIPLAEANPFEGIYDYSIQMTFTSSKLIEILFSSALTMSAADDRPMMLYTPEWMEPPGAEVHFWYRGGIQTDSLVNLNDGMRHTLVVTYDAVTQGMRFYSDGVEDGSLRFPYWMRAIADHIVRIGGCPSYAFRRDMLGFDYYNQANFEGEIDSFRIYDYVLSELEAMYLATDGTGIRTIPWRANLYNEEAPGSRAVNFRDYAELASAWLERSYWP
ncbi:MAG: LamG-like jellyroll fold domain-containing protein [Planctomycetota bacterium]|jgi:hypothetical protein